MLFRRKQAIDPGDYVRVAGHVGGELDDGSTFELKGERGQVVREYESKTVRNRKGEPERMAGIILESGAVVGVPIRALKQD